MTTPNTLGAPCPRCGGVVAHEAGCAEAYPPNRRVGETTPNAPPDVELHDDHIGLLECMQMVRDDLAVLLGDETVRALAPMFVNDAVRALGAQRDAARAEAERLRADAARLDWLDAMLWSPGDASTDDTPYIGDVRLYGSWTAGARRAVQVGDDNQPIYDADTVRDAIDAARRATREGRGASDA